MSKTKTLLAALAIVLGCGANAAAQNRAAWMQQAKWGVMTHYLADWQARVHNLNMSVEEWNKLIDGFDAVGIAKQLQSVGAGYYQISIGQNSGYYLSPNAAYDKIAGIQPSKCSRRDLVADLHEALNKRGIRLMVYLPSGAPGADKAADAALEWRNGPYPNREFQRKWEQVIREWSERWGKRVAGEIDKPELATIRRSVDGVMDGVQIHILSYLGQTWGMGAPRFPAEQVIEYTRKIRESGGAVTWDVPVELNGTISQPFLDQLAALGKALASK